MRFLKSLFYLFYPNNCVACEKILLQNEIILCVNCSHSLPIIENNQFTRNKIKSTFYGRVPIKNAFSFLYFTKLGNVQKLIHQLKYRNTQEIGSYIGNLFGEKLKEIPGFNSIDYIISVPLHPKKLKKRGYNQVTTFANTLAILLQSNHKTGILTRTSISKTQTFKQRFERFSNNKTTFKLTDHSIFENKHILRVDDVITTGATIEACCNELLKTKNITISIATMAFTEKT